MLCAFAPVLSFAELFVCLDRLEPGIMIAREDLAAMYSAKLEESRDRYRCNVLLDLSGDVFECPSISSLA